MNLTIAWFAVFVLFGGAVFCLIKARTWLGLNTDKEYRGFLTFVGVLFIFLISISTFIYVKLNPDVFEEKNITITKNNEYNDVYKYNFSDIISLEDLKNQSSSSELTNASSSYSSSSIS